MPGSNTQLPQWLAWARELQAMAQNGLNYARDPYDRERYARLREIAAEIAAAGSGRSATELLAVFSRETGHATPKVDVRAAVFQGDAVLLVKEAADGGWTLPGGWADPGEGAGEGAAREAREESGYLVRPTRLLALYDRDKHGHPPHPFSILKAFFDCDLLGGEPTTSSETTGVGFFPVHDLPPLSLGRITSEEIERLFYLHNNPDLPADFD